VFRKKQSETTENSGQAVGSEKPYAWINKYDRSRRPIERNHVYSAPQQVPPPLPANALANDIAGTASAIWDKKSYIIVTTLIVTLIALAAAFLLPKSFEATNQIFIDPRSKALVD